MEGESMRRPSIGPNAFEPFFGEVDRLLSQTQLQRTGENLAEYARVVEIRRNYFDIINRVETLAFAFGRLAELGPAYRQASRDIEGSKSPIEGQPGYVEVPDQLIEIRDRLELEARSLAFLIYYELAALEQVFRHKEVAIALTGEIAYAVAARDRMLAHRPASINRMSNSKVWISQGDLLINGIVDPMEGDPRMIEYYSGNPFTANTAEDIENERQTNEAFFRSSKNKESRKKKLKVFGVREPDLDLVLKELVTLLHQDFLPKLADVAVQPIQVGESHVSVQRG
jgi:hypothetical protein